VKVSAMRRGWRVWGAIGALLVAGCASAPREEAAKGAAVARGRGGELLQKMSGLERRSGLFDLYLDRDAGRLWALLPAADEAGTIGDYLWYEGLTAGLGSNPLGLDRGQLGEGVLVRLRREGRRLLVEHPNLRYRALSEDGAERAAVAESFARSVVFATDIEAEDGAGRSLVDLTDFLLRDAHGVGARLAASGEGSFAVDRQRSVVSFDDCLAFPQNVELESLVTFAGSGAGGEVRGVTPDPSAITLVQHQSFVALPEAGYRPREHDPRMGSYSVEFVDFAAPLDRPLTRRWIVRHRLQKVDPSAASSPVVEPIVYYVDRGAPEPVRSALIEGASWWAKAFEAAGFEDAFRVEVLPEGIHPLDVRYNVIQWVHRATRGWSYGGGIIDPRTGEMLKGQVTLGSQRIRQDRMIFEGLAGIARTGTGAPDDPVELSLARLRQLAAHEVGHTLGLNHNFAGSATGRSSVMDYPAPWVHVDPEGELDFSEAYGVGVGAWDVAAIRWAYSEFPEGADEAAALDRIVRETLDAGLPFLTDGDARAPGSPHPMASLWDNGADPVAALQETIRVRRIALARFGEPNLAAGRPLAELEEVFVPLFLHHRFEVAAASKLVGGLQYRHALRDDGQPGPQWVPAAQQRRALSVLLDTLAPGFLDVPATVTRTLVPRAPEMRGSEELFAGRSGRVFDPLSAAATAAEMTLDAILEPSRAARLVDAARRTGTTPDLTEVLDAIVARVFADRESRTLREAEIGRVVERVVVERFFDLATDSGVAPWVRTRVDLALAGLLQRLDQVVALDAAERAHYDALAAEIGRHLARPMAPRETVRSAQPAPPGEPIGSATGELSGCSFDAP